MIVAWALIGYLAAARAPHVVEVLNTRGGSRSPTEASRVDEILRTRFSKPLNDFFAVTLEAPQSFEVGASRELLDSLIARFERRRFILGVVSFRSTGDSSFVSKDGKASVLLLALVPAKGDSVARMVLQVRKTVSETLSDLRLDSGLGYGSPADRHSISMCARSWPAIAAEGSFDYCPSRWASCCWPSVAR